MFFHSFFMLRWSAIPALIAAMHKNMIPVPTQASACSHLCHISDRSFVEAASAWDAMRLQVVRDALCEFLLPQMEREARARLAAMARSAVLEEAGDQLWGYASQAPLQVRWNWCCSCFAALPACCQICSFSTAFSLARNLVGLFPPTNIVCSHLSTLRSGLHMLASLATPHSTFVR